MVFAKINSAGLVGFESHLVEVEVDVNKGLPALVVVGLPDASVRESRDRVKSAILNCDYTFPDKKVTINLAPADMRKEGPNYDLPMALGVLQASGQIPEKGTVGAAFMGELSLDGRLRPIKGALIAVKGLEEGGVERVYLPESNSREAALCPEVEVYPVRHLSQIVGHLQGEKSISPLAFSPEDLADLTPGGNFSDFGEVMGQSLAKRALTIAAAGGHNILMMGPPGSGKTMLARRFPSILPALTLDEMVEVTSVYSIAGMLGGRDLMTVRPFRAPHHTTSHAGLVGGGSNPRPGEISLSHRGVLFLDELPEFARSTLEVLRQPLEEGLIRIGRAAANVVFPAELQFIGAMNPCPCGYYSHPEKACRCSARQVQSYLSRLSGPLLDRIDLQIEVQPVPFSNLSLQRADPVTSDQLRPQVDKAREVQRERLSDEAVTVNGEMSDRQVKKYCHPTKEAKQLLRQAFRHLQLSGRSYQRLLKISRTVADMEGDEVIDSSHVGEVVQYRSLDRIFR